MSYNRKLPAGGELWQISGLKGYIQVVEIYMCTRNAWITECRAKIKYNFWRIPDQIRLLSKVINDLIVSNCWNGTRCNNNNIINTLSKFQYSSFYWFLLILKDGFHKNLYSNCSLNIKEIEILFLLNSYQNLKLYFGSHSKVGE